jgi:hypothetical protein
MVSLWLIAIPLRSSLPAPATGRARLYLENVPLHDEKLLAVSISLADVVDLYGAEVQLRYNPNQLQVRDSILHIEGVQITPGPLLANHDRFIVRNIVDTRTGLINFAVTYLNPSPAINGDGILATILFEITGDGPYLVEVSQARLVSANAEIMPIITKDFYLSGSTEVVATSWPNISSPSSWPWWGKTALVISLPCIFALLIFLFLRQVDTIRGSAHTMARRIPGAGRSSRRSAAILTQQGNFALKQGSIQEAYELFSQAIELDPANKEAWLGKGLVAQQEMEQHICFQRVLALDPNNPTARTELQQLDRPTSR